MALDTSAFTGFLLGTLSTAVFWLLVVLAIVAFGFGGLWIRKKRKLRNPIVEIVPLGRGKMGFNRKKVHGRGKLKGGWFGCFQTFMGLWDYGPREVYRTSDGREVMNVSSRDYHEIDGQLGLIVIRSPENPKVLLPINKMLLEQYSYSVLAKIPPGDYVGTVLDVVKRAEKETQDRTQKIIQMAVLGLVIVVFFVSIIIITQMVTKSTDSSKDLILEAGKLSKENLEIMCKGLGTIGEALPPAVAP